MQIKVINQNDPILKEVVALGKKNAKTLGMFPEGAFIDHAKRKLLSPWRVKLCSAIFCLG